MRRAIASLWQLVGLDRRRFLVPTVFDEGEGDLSSCSLGLDLMRRNDEPKQDEQDQEQPDQDGEDNEHPSRSTSMNRRRKRGACCGKGQIILQ